MKDFEVIAELVPNRDDPKHGLLAWFVRTSGGNRVATFVEGVKNCYHTRREAHALCDLLNTAA